MYGFTPHATTEKLESPPPDRRSSTPEQGGVLEELVELGLVDTRERHVGQDPKDDKDPEDVEHPAPDVRRPEGVQQRIEHRSLRACVAAGLGLGASAGVSGDGLGGVARPSHPVRRRARRALPASSGSVTSAASTTSVGASAGAASAAGALRRGRPLGAFFGRSVLADAMAGRSRRPGRLRRTLRRARASTLRSASPDRRPFAPRVGRLDRLHVDAKSREQFGGDLEHVPRCRRRPRSWRLPTLV